MPSVSPSTRPLLLVLLLVMTALAWWGAQPPRALPVTAPPDQFSGMRALEHSRTAFNEPHPAGSAALEKVRDYILATLQGYGVEVEVDRVPVNEGARIGVLETVMARIPGTGGANTFAMETHYDSVPYGPGAADDGSGVVVMLETARALKQGPPLKNDVVFVFSGDEEHGMGGATRSLRHRWMQNLNVLLCFEARGNHGPAFMFETSAGNLPLMRELARAGACPQTNSIMWEVHHRTPNNTDFGGMKDNGALGYNVAFVGGLGYYHSANDNPAHLSPHSLQHQGSYALGLARHYGDATGKMSKGRDAVFFNTVGAHLVVYPASWSRPITCVAVALLLLALGYGLVRRTLSVGGILASVLLCAAALALVGAITFPLLRITYRLYYVYLTYNGVWYLLAFLAIAGAVVAALYGWAGRRVMPENLLAGALVLWTVALVGIEINLPTGSYVAAWPVILGAVALVVATVLRGRGAATAAALAETLLVLPALLFAVPGIQAIYYMGPGFTVIPSAMLAVAVAGLLAPAVVTVLGRKSLRVSACFAAAGAVLMVVGWATNGFTPDKPKMSSLAYALNQTTNKAIWMSTDDEPDAYTRQFFGTGVTKGAITDVLPDRDSVCLRAEAPVANIDGPRVEKLSDATDNGRRTVRLRYVSPRKVNQTRIKVLAPQQVHAASAAGFGELRPGGGDWSLDATVMPRTGEVTLTLTVDTDKPLRLRVEEDEQRLLDVTSLGFTARPPQFIPKPNTIDWWESLIRRRGNPSSHHTVVVKEFEI